MFNKFLAFFGLAQLVFTGDKAVIEVSEDKAKEMNTRIEELDDAEATISKLKADLEASQTEARELTLQNEKLQKKVTEQDAAIAELKGLPAADGAKAKTDTDTPQALTDGPVTLESNDFETNMQLVSKTYFGE